MAEERVFAPEVNAMTTELNSLADTSAASTTTEITNAVNRYVDMYLDISVAAAGAATGTVAIYLLYGSTTALLSTTELPNMRFIGNVTLNGTTVVRKTFFVEGVAEFWKARLVNNGGAALASSANTIKYTGISKEVV